MRNTLALVVVAASLTACAGRGVPGTLEPDLAAAAISATAPDRPLRMVFDWRMLEGDARFSGSGVARVEPPYQARLDLFGPRGEGYVSAALVDGQVRLPPGARSVPLPPAAMMWAVLGVVAPPAEATLAGTRVRDGRVELHYAVGESRLRYTVEDGRLRSVLWEGEGRRMDVELAGTAHAMVPREAVFRDWSGYTELRIELGRVDEVDAFPPEIWSPGA